MRFLKTWQSHLALGACIPICRLNHLRGDHEYEAPANSSEGTRISAVRHLHRVAPYRIHPAIRGRFCRGIRLDLQLRYPRRVGSLVWRCAGAASCKSLCRVRIEGLLFARWATRHPAPIQTAHYDSAPMSGVIVRLLANATSRTNCSVSLGPLLALRGQPTNVP